VRRAALIIAAAGFLLAPMNAAVAQSVRPEDRNAAIKYSWAFFTLPQELLNKVGEVGMDLSDTMFEKEAGKQPKDFVEAAKELEPYSISIQQLIDASKLRRCDHEIEYEKGIAALLPHLGKMRQAVRVLRFDARRLIIEGDAAAAAERIATMVRMARHLRSDRTLISSLVAAAITNTAAVEAEAELESGLLSAEARRTILAAFQELDAVDPFAMKEAVRGEQAMTLNWIKATFDGEDAGRRLLAMAVFDDPGAKASLMIGSMNGTQLSAAVDLMSPYYDQVLAVWDQEDSVAQLQKLGERVKGGEFGPVGQVLAPALDNAKKSSLRIEGIVRRVVEKLGAKKDE
jgi:hypothetical protein